jgi:hypothetical protein
MIRPHIREYRDLRVKRQTPLIDGIFYDQPLGVIQRSSLVAHGPRLKDMRRNTIAQRVTGMSGESILTVDPEMRSRVHDAYGIL